MNDDNKVESAIAGLNCWASYATANNNLPCICCQCRKRGTNPLNIAVIFMQLWQQSTCHTNFKPAKVVESKTHIDTAILVPVCPDVIFADYIYVLFGIFTMVAKISIQWILLSNPGPLAFIS